MVQIVNKCFFYGYVSSSRLLIHFFGARRSSFNESRVTNLISSYSISFVLFQGHGQYDINKEKNWVGDWTSQ